MAVPILLYGPECWARDMHWSNWNEVPKGSHGL